LWKIGEKSGKLYINSWMVNAGKVLSDEEVNKRNYR